MMHWGTYGWGMGFGWLWMALVWALIIGGVAYAVKAASRSVVHHDSKETPRDILKKRYAKGEITKQEFERQLEDLKKY
ncbi:MAG: SHOCT domain-containing protein [Betaproteobacteria bacterium]